MSAEVTGTTGTTGDLLTPEELAAQLGHEGMGVARSREWVKSNGRRGIPTVKLGRYYRYRQDSIAGGRRRWRTARPRRRMWRIH